MLITNQFGKVHKRKKRTQNDLRCPSPRQGQPTLAGESASRGCAVGGSVDAAVAIKNVLEEPLGDYPTENVAWQRPIAAFLKIRGCVRAFIREGIDAIC